MGYNIALHMCITPTNTIFCLTKAQVLPLPLTIHSFHRFILLQVPVHLPTFLLSQLVPPVSEFPGPHQPQGPLWWGIGYTTMQREPRVDLSTMAVWTLVLVQLNIPCPIFREAYGILSPWLQDHSISRALPLVLYLQH